MRFSWSCRFALCFPQEGGCGQSGQRLRPPRFRASHRSNAIAAMTMQTITMAESRMPRANRSVSDIPVTISRYRGTQARETEKSRTRSSQSSTIALASPRPPRFHGLSRSCRAACVWRRMRGTPRSQARGRERQFPIAPAPRTPSVFPPRAMIRILRCLVVRGRTRTQARSERTSPSCAVCRVEFRSCAARSLPARSGQRPGAKPSRTAE